MTGKRNIGGSLLPSNDPGILRPLAGTIACGGSLQVRVIQEQDTHGLYLLPDTLLVVHPNGYSCHTLAKRLVCGEFAKARDQADYIVRCGGVVMDACYVLMANLEVTGNRSTT